VPTGDRRHVASAHLVFVGLDNDGKPAPVPQVIAESDDERRRQQQAKIRREQRLLRKKALAQAAEQVR
jgi:acyl-CoA hydrolase